MRVNLRKSVPIRGPKFRRCEYERYYDLREPCECHHSPGCEGLPQALKSLKANSRNRTAQADKRENERFFRSQWYSALTDVDGEMLIRFLQKEVDA